jgi:hypothetical protein
MKRFSVMFEVFSSTIVEVDAETPEEAREKASEQVSVPCLCWQCAKELDANEIGEVLEVLEVETSE